MASVVTFLSVILSVLWSFDSTLFFQTLCQAIGGPSFPLIVCRKRKQFFKQILTGAFCQTVSGCLSGKKRICYTTIISFSPTEILSEHLYFLYYSLINLKKEAYHHLAHFSVATAFFCGVFLQTLGVHCCTYFFFCNSFSCSCLHSFSWLFFKVY
ncbi:hypothetical protein LguiA_007296 [Lonicera macranthoides]